MRRYLDAKAWCSRRARWRAQSPFPPPPSSFLDRPLDREDDDDHDDGGNEKLAKTDVLLRNPTSFDTATERAHGAASRQASAPEALSLLRRASRRDGDDRDDHEPPKSTIDEGVSKMLLK